MATSAGLEQRIREIAEELAREFGGIEEEENSCLMTRVEDFAAEIGDSVAGRVMERELENRDKEQDVVCPCCKQPGHVKRHRKRTIETKRGPIEIIEAEYYCKPCRRSFFPSVETIWNDTK
tara:strand:+ start:128 stop:490 length:363 start_codon:yes stop_codon:yes gene_type:complete